MRSSLAALALISLANASCVNNPCGSRKCLGAIGADQAVGEAFCSSWLSFAPPGTTTVTEVKTATSTITSIETNVSTLTVTTATVTETTGSASVAFQKRVPTITFVSSASAISSAPADNILSQCRSNNDRISKACSCFLSTATASVITVTETAVSTVTDEATSTLLSTVTTNIIATTSVPPPATTIPSNVLPNGNLESYLSTGNILPWTIQNPTGGRIETINGVNPCITGGTYCAGGQVVVRAYPPTSGGGYVALRETFDARPLRTYNVRFMYRCLNFDANSGMEVWYNGVRVGVEKCPNINTSAFQRIADGAIQFTTGETGTGELEVRFLNPSNSPYLYVYADDFQAVVV